MDTKEPVRSEPSRRLLLAGALPAAAGALGVVGLTAGPASAETKSPVPRRRPLSPSPSPSPVLKEKTRAKFPADLETAGVAELAGLLDSGRITSVQLTREYLRRIGALDVQGPGLNTVRSLNPNALKEAGEADARRRRSRHNSPLLGIPVLLKDNIDAVGMPTTAGSVALKDSHPDKDAPLVALLRSAGAVILGKANLTEFANYLTNGMPGGYSSLGGQVLNVYDVSQTPSGSSAGPGAAASVGLATLTIGTETSGSILSPAAANSDVGVKPTVGLISRTGIVPIAASQDTAGPLVRTVADAAALLTVVTGEDPEDSATAANPLVGHDFSRDLSPTALRGARIGVVASQVPAAGTDNRTLWDAALAVLTARGATLVSVTLSTSSSIPGGSSVLSYEFKRDLNTYLARLPRNAPAKTLADVVAYNNAHSGRALKFGQVLATASQAMDLSPGSADSAKYLADRAQDLADSKDRIDALMADQNLTTLLFANSGSAGIGAKAGYPSVSVPAGYQAANRRPFNIAFLGKAWSEPVLLGYAYDYEQASQLRQPPSALNPSLFDNVGL
ncbi:amidase [Streptomyces sp. DvalAA-14]|uniref:amidase family protein n=1 Tax=unclassified Streptomyces TaxID=2593676 RepID=UPI00081B92AD|nr:MULTISPECIES: amidase family protein [unclassified Streptomyces]MYS20808.1 amidase [Streptomyces sp. SID4948]SCD77723.1 amidase [Streptomyces sp. DvalAA-14]